MRQNNSHRSNPKDTKRRNRIYTPNTCIVSYRQSLQTRRSIDLKLDTEKNIPRSIAAASRDENASILSSPFVLPNLLGIPSSYEGTERDLYLLNLSELLLEEGFLSDDDWEGSLIQSIQEGIDRWSNKYLFVDDMIIFHPYISIDEEPELFSPSDWKDLAFEEWGYKELENVNPDKLEIGFISLCCTESYSVDCYEFMDRFDSIHPAGGKAILHVLEKGCNFIGGAADRFWIDSEIEIEHDKPYIEQLSEEVLRLVEQGELPREKIGSREFEKQIDALFNSDKTTFRYEFNNLPKIFRDWSAPVDTSSLYELLRKVRTDADKLLVHDCIHLELEIKNFQSVLDNMVPRDTPINHKKAQGNIYYFLPFLFAWDPHDICHRLYDDWVEHISETEHTDVIFMSTFLWKDIKQIRFSLYSLWSILRISVRVDRIMQGLSNDIDERFSDGRTLQTYQERDKNHWCPKGSRIFQEELEL